MALEVLIAASELLLHVLILALSAGLGVGLAKVALFLVTLDKRHGA